MIYYCVSVGGSNGSVFLVNLLVFKQHLTLTSQSYLHFRYELICLKLDNVSKTLAIERSLEGTFLHKRGVQHLWNAS